MTTTTSNALEVAHTTILGFGSLLSERSARSTFPSLTSFRLACLVDNDQLRYKRVFSHPSAFFFKTGIARPDTVELSSLSCDVYENEMQKRNGVGEKEHGNTMMTTTDAEGDSTHDCCSDTDPNESDCDADHILVSAFQIPAQELPAFYRREATYVIRAVPFKELDVEALAKDVAAYYAYQQPLAGASGDNNTKETRKKMQVTKHFRTPLSCLSAAGNTDGMSASSVEPPVGLLCCTATDAHYIESWGKERFEQEYISRGLTSIWKYPDTTKQQVLFPARCYLRHCLLSAEHWDRERLPSMLLPYLEENSTPKGPQKQSEKTTEHRDTEEMGDDKLMKQHEDNCASLVETKKTMIRMILKDSLCLSVFDNFLDATYLYDRSTPLRAYVQMDEAVVPEYGRIENPDIGAKNASSTPSQVTEVGNHRTRSITMHDVLNEAVPKELSERYNGG